MKKLDAAEVFKEAANRKLRDTIIVDAKEYRICTDVLNWFVFELSYDLFISGMYNITKFDTMYPFFWNAKGDCWQEIPPDREKGFAELLKFYLEPFGGKLPKGRVCDYALDEIGDPFYEYHGLEFGVEDIHFHRFVMILDSLIDTGKMRDYRVVS